MTKARLLIILLAIVRCSSGQITLGQKAPELRLGPVVSGNPSGPSAGHALLIEFWATWCLPCRENIPHLNQLADRFQNRGIDFLSLTSEAVGVVKDFLKAYPIHGAVAIDPDGVNASAFGVSAK